ncbi:MAG: diguanylate cyclase [Clostridium sp.]
MNLKDEKREDAIKKVVNSFKIIVLILCGIIFLKTSFQVVIKFEEVRPLILGMICFVLAITYLFTISTDNKIINIEDSKFLKGLECLVLLFFCSMVIYESGGILSSYRFILIMVIVLITIENSKVVAIIASWYSCFFIILLSYNYYNDFEKVIINDVPLGISLIVIAIFLRSYISIEDESRRRILQDANVDYLTKVYNRRFFNKYLRDSLDEVKIKSKPLSMLLLDIDYFKSVNDTYGHGFGDEVLEDIAAIIKKQLGRDSLVARFGGEEFAIILKNFGANEAVYLAENIRRTIQEHKFYYKDNKNPIRITVSIGVCTYPDKADNSRELINRVDDALYKAKFLDRNRVEVYDSILEEIRRDILDENPEFYSSLKSIMNAINSKDEYTLGHSERMVMYADLISNELCLCESDKKILRYSAYMHDIGKITLSKSLLQKGYNYSEDEKDEFMAHSIEGVEIIKDIKPLLSIHDSVLHHHEKYDGTGYPHKLRGEEIPYFARIISVINEFDILTSTLSGDSKSIIGSVINILKNQRGSDFDPEILDVFINVILKNEKVFYNLNKNTINIKQVGS